jgi:hypothetical protein
MWTSSTGLKRHTMMVTSCGSFAESAHRRFDAEVHAGTPREITADREQISPARAQKPGRTAQKSQDDV